MSYEKEIGTHLANLIVEMVSIVEEGERVTGFELDHVKSMDAFQKAAPVYKQKALKAYEDSFDKHEHEGQAKAHEHGMNAAREVFVRMKKNAKASSNRRERDGVMRDMGMTKVRGAQSGKAYWESFNVVKELGLDEEIDTSPKYSTIAVDASKKAWKATEKAKKSQSPEDHMAASRQHHAAAMTHAPGTASKAHHDQSEHHKQMSVWVQKNKQMS